MSTNVRGNIVICHYRVGRTDGVSLEIEKRRQVLSRMGWNVILVAGTGSEDADYVIEELDFDLPEVRKITENSFGQIKDYQSPEKLIQHIDNIAKRIEKRLDEMYRLFQPQLLLVHNIFSHGRHIAAAKAFFNFIQLYELKTVATHHDFYWERSDFLNSSCKEIHEYLNYYVPPQLPILQHVVINSLSQKILYNRCGIEARIIPDTIDFGMSTWKQDVYNGDLLEKLPCKPHDIVILQATRIVPRKGIEIMIPILEQLNTPEYIHRMVGARLYNGKTIGKDSRFFLLLAGYAEEEALEYKKELTDYMDHHSIPHCFIDQYIAAERRVVESKKYYSLFDTYPFADCVSYPSQYEGWGNQFLEAVFAKKPVIIFEYPVYKSDIKPAGYEVITLGDQVVRDTGSGWEKLPTEVVPQACERIVTALLSPDTNNLLEHNFRVAKEKNSFDFLQRCMKESIDDANIPAKN